MDKRILPVLLYENQTWTLTQRQKKKVLTVTQRRMERKTLQITLQDHTTNAEIKNKTQIKDISHAAQEFRWRWTGHIIRLDHNCMQQPYGTHEMYQEGQGNSNELLV